MGTASRSMESKNRVAFAASREPTATVGGFATRVMLVGFEKLGLVPARLCEAAGTDLSQMMDPLARVSPMAFWAVWREAEKASGDPFLGFHLAQTVPFAAAGGMIGQLAAVSGTGVEAIRHFARYRKLMGAGLDVGVQEDETTLSIEIHLPYADDASARQVYEGILWGTLRILREAIMADLTPSRVPFRHAPPSDITLHESLFGCPVEFRAGSCGMGLPLASLRQPMIAAQARAESRLQDLLESELRTFAPEFTIAVAEQVRAALEQHERPTQASIARRLGVGPRTLQRRLRAEGGSFRRIADREHRHLALGLLRRPDGRVIDVAQAVGFDDATSFSKAFRRWTGESPTAYRARVLDGTA